MTATTTAYAASVGSDPASKTAAAAETAYYKSTIGTVNSVGALLADKRLVAYVEKAYGLPAGTSTDQLRSVLTRRPAGRDERGQHARHGVSQASPRRSRLPRQVSSSSPRQRGAQTATQQIATDTAYGRSALEGRGGDGQHGGQAGALLPARRADHHQRLRHPRRQGAPAGVPDRIGFARRPAPRPISMPRRATLQSKVNFADLKDPVKLNQMVQAVRSPFTISPIRPPPTPFPRCSAHRAAEAGASRRGLATGKTRG